MCEFPVMKDMSALVHVTNVKVEMFLKPDCIDLCVCGGTWQCDSSYWTMRNVTFLP